MIKILFKQRLAEKSLRERRTITMHDVTEATGISRATLTRIANIPGYNTNTYTLDLLCNYLDCEPGELLELRNTSE